MSVGEVRTTEQKHEENALSARPDAPTAEHVPGRWSETPGWEGQADPPGHITATQSTERRSPSTTEIRAEHDPRIQGLIAASAKRAANGDLGRPDDPDLLNQRLAERVAELLGELDAQAAALRELVDALTEGYEFKKGDDYDANLAAWNAMADRRNNALAEARAVLAGGKRPSDLEAAVDRERIDQENL